MNYTGTESLLESGTKPRVEHRALAQRSDEDLVRAVAAGDRGALAALYDRFAPVLMALGQRVLRCQSEAEDLVHDVFIEVFRQAGAYDPARGTVCMWLLVRARSRALDRLRPAGHARTVLLDASGMSDHAAPAEERDPALSLDCALVRRALERLPAEQRQAIELAYFEGLSLAEIAERIAVSIGTIKSRISRGVDRLRVSLEVGQTWE